MFVQPMLASGLPEGKKISDFHVDEWVMEEKFDGHRLIIQVDQSDVLAWSRQMNARQLPEKVVRELRKFPYGIYDTEGLIPGGTSTDVVDRTLQDQLTIVVFDVLAMASVEFPESPQSSRRALLEDIFKFSEVYRQDREVIRIAEQFDPNEETLKGIWDRGGEGVILKHRKALYVPGLRSRDWVKMKKEFAEPLTIVGFAAGLLGPHSMVLGKNAEGTVISVKSLNDQWRADFAQHAESYIGRTLVISHQGRTKHGRYRHPMADHIV